MPRVDRVLLAGLVSALLLSAAASRAQGILDLESEDDLRAQPVTLTADALEYESEREVYIARGNVVLEQGERTLRADWAAFNPDTGAGVASGNVELVEGEDVLRADFVDFNVETLEGVIRAGSLDSPASQFRARGDEIQKTGDKTYTFENAVFTTCRCPDEEEDEPWRIRAKEADVDVGGHGTVRDATIEVQGVPVMWLPWMIYPIKTERQTGFLFPEMSLASRDGFGLGVPFFWAPSERWNLTLTPEYTTDRGFAGSSELEYVFGEASEGEAVFGLAFDEEIDRNSRKEPYDRERWVAAGEHDWDLPGRVRFATEYAFASDNDVPLDFDELSGARSDRYLESRASLARGFGATDRFGGVASVWWAEDLQNPDDVDRDDFLMQRLPQVEVDALVGGVPLVPWIQPSLEVDYSYFHQLEDPDGATDGFVDSGVDGVVDAAELARPGAVGPDPHEDNFATTGGTEGDGVFQPGELLSDTGHRVIMHPKVAAPFRLGSLAEVYPEVGWQQTLYATDEHGGDQRGLLTGRVDLRSRLRRSYENLVHVVEPHVGWAYVSPQAQRDKPLFVPGTDVPQERLRALDLENVTRDFSDRVERAHLVTFGLTQRVLDTSEERGRRGLAGDVTVVGLYDIERGEMQNVAFDGRITPEDFGDLRFNLGLRPRESKLVREGLAEWSWMHRDGHRLSAGYRYLRDIPQVFEDFRSGNRFDDFEDEEQISELSTNVRIALTPLWTASYRLAFSFETDEVVRNKGGLEYLSECGCWSLGAEFSEDRASGIDVKLVYRIIGLGIDQDPNRGGLLDW